MADPATPNRHRPPLARHAALSDPCRSAAGAVVGAVAAVVIAVALSGAALAQARVPAAPDASAAPEAPAASGVRNAAERFDRVWTLVEDRYWDLAAAGVDWEAQREPYRERALAAGDEAGFYAVLEEMVALLADDHSRFVSPAAAAEVRDAYGDLPCLGVFSLTPPAIGPRPPAWTGTGATLAQAGGRSGTIAWRLDDALGVITVPDLASDGVTAGVRRAIEALEAQRAKALVLDLRGNPGGRLITMMTTAGLFVDGLLWRVATTWSLPLPYPALGATATALPLAVLIDGDVHSAAEGLAGALQASDRATVVGETSAGNVEAVLPFCLRDGSQVWLASGVLAPLLGPTWEGRGVEPDVRVPGGDALEAAREVLLGGS